MSLFVRKALVVGILVFAVAAVAAPAQAVTIDELMAQIATLQAQLVQLQGATSTATSVSEIPAGSTFAKNLAQGASGSDVKSLQIFLNRDSATQVAASGAGSAGNETSYFGPATKAAVVKFQEKYASDVLTPVGLTKGTGFVGAGTRAKLNAMLAGSTATTPTTTTPTTTTPTTTTPTPVTTTPVAGQFTVATSAETPATGTIVQGQSVANLAKFTFANGTANAVKVTGLKLTRLGVSADSTLTNTYLYNGASRVTDAASVSSGVITFNNSAGIFAVPANSTVTITVLSDIAGSTSGQTSGVGIANVAAVTTDGATVAGSFPANGNVMSIASATLGTVAFAASTTPTTNASLDPQNDFTMWQNSVSVGTRAVSLTRMAFRHIGSINYADLKNFRLFVDGVQVGSAVDALDANGYVTFDLSASAKKLETGNRVVVLRGDIIGGSSRTLTISVRVAADASFVDSQYGVNLLPTVTGGSFPVSAGQQTVSSGTVTVTKKANAPSGNVVNGASAQTLATYEVKSAGEPVKIESLRVSFRATDGTNATTDVDSLRNGQLYWNGVQVGSTADINEDNHTTTYTTYSLGSSMIVTPGAPGTLEVKADVFDSDGTNNLDANDTIQIVIEGEDLNNAFGQISGSTIDVPASDQTGNSLTISTGGLTLSKYTAYPNTTFVAPQSKAKIAHFTLSANTTETVNLNTISVDLDGKADAFDASDDLSNLYLVYGDQTTTAKATVADTSNSWSINYAMTSGKTIDLVVYADIASSSTNGDATADTIRADVTITGTSAVSGTAANATEQQGQTITSGTGSFTAAIDGSTPLTQVVSGSTAADVAAGTPKTLTASTFKFTAVNDAFTVNEVKVKVGSDVSGVLLNAVLKDGSTVLGTKPFDLTTNTTAHFTGLSVTVPANTTKVLTVDLQLNQPSADKATTNKDVKITLDWVKYANSQGSVTSDDTPGAGDTEPAGNSIYVLQSIPTVTKVALGSTNRSLINGNETDLYTFKVAADAKGSIAVKQLNLQLSWSDLGTGDSLELESVKIFRDGVDYTDSVVITDQDGTSVESTDGATEGDTDLMVNFTTEDVIGAGQSREYVVKATSQGFKVAAPSETTLDSVSVYLEGDASANTRLYLTQASTNRVALGATANAAYAAGTANNFIWSDLSSLAHASSAGATAGADWTNGYLVKNMNLAGETWSR